MSQASSSIPSGMQRKNRFPLIECPQCGREKLRLLQSTTAEHPGLFFVKYSRNEKGNRNRECMFYLWLDQYMKFIIEIGMFNGDEHVTTVNASVRTDDYDALRVQVAGLSRTIDKMAKTAEHQLLVLCFIALVVILVLLVILVK